MKKKKKKKKKKKWKTYKEEQFNGLSLENSYSFIYVLKEFPKLDQLFWKPTVVYMLRHLVYCSNIFECRSFDII
jgi:hypothetical protein